MNDIEGLKELIIAKVNAKEYETEEGLMQFKTDLEEIIQRLQEENDYAAYSYQEAWNAGYAVAKAEDGR